jgi:hypothetical protein
MVRDRLPFGRWVGPVCGPPGGLFEAGDSGPLIESGVVSVPVKLDSAGIREVLLSAPVREAIDGFTAQVAAGVAAAVPAGTEIVTDSYSTDRAAGVVVVKDVRAQGWQAADGVLTRAAAAAGLEVTEVVLYTTKAGKTRKATAAQVANWTRNR